MNDRSTPGDEPVFGPWRAVTVGDALARLPSPGEDPPLAGSSAIAVGGCGGVGETALAARLADALPAAQWLGGRIRGSSAGGKGASRYRAGAGGRSSRAPAPRAASSRLNSTSECGSRRTCSCRTGACWSGRRRERPVHVRGATRARHSGRGERRDVVGPHPRTCRRRAVGVQGGCGRCAVGVRSRCKPCVAGVLPRCGRGVASAWSACRQGGESVLERGRRTSGWRAIGSAGDWRRRRAGGDRGGGVRMPPRTPFRRRCRPGRARSARTGVRRSDPIPRSRGCSRCPAWTGGS